MSNYDVKIQLTPGTLASLAAGGFSLFVWRSIAATVSGQPVICTSVATAGLESDTIQLTFGRDYGIYISQSAIADFGTIAITALVPLQYGQVLNLYATDGLKITITDDGPADAITVYNLSIWPWTAGPVQAGPQIRPSAAFPLYGNMSNKYKPLETILLAFSSYPIGSGTILKTLRSQGALADMSTASSLAVSFDINKGWDFGGQPGTIIPINTSLTPLLISHTALEP
jgi:hypothetical protein